MSLATLRAALLGHSGGSIWSRLLLSGLLSLSAPLSWETYVQGPDGHRKALERPWSAQGGLLCFIEHPPRMNYTSALMRAMDSDHPNAPWHRCSRELHPTLQSAWWELPVLSLHFTFRERPHSQGRVFWSSSPLPVADGFDSWWHLTQV